MAGLFATAPERSRNLPSACGRMLSRSYWREEVALGAFAGEDA